MHLSDHMKSMDLQSKREHDLVVKTWLAAWEEFEIAAKEAAEQSAQNNHFRGHPIIWVEESQNWAYLDNNQPIDIDRSCGKCGKSFVPTDGDGEVDPCLGVLPGVANACCGHGTKRESYIQFENGVRVWDFYVDTSETASRLRA